MHACRHIRQALSRPAHPLFAVQWPTFDGRQVHQFTEREIAFHPLPPCRPSIIRVTSPRVSATRSLCRQHTSQSEEYLLRAPFAVPSLLSDTPLPLHTPVMSNYPGQRPFLYNLFSAFRPYAPHKPAVTATSTTQQFSSQASSQAPQTSHTLSPPASPSGPHAQITQQATARAIAAKQQPSSQPFQSAAAAFSPPTHHTTRSHQARKAAQGPASPYSPPTFGGRNRRGSDSSSDNEGFVQRPGNEKWFIGGRMGNGEERFYQLSMVRRERSNDRKSCDRMSL